MNKIKIMVPKGKNLKQLIMPYNTAPIDLISGETFDYVVIDNKDIVDRIINDGSFVYVEEA